MTVIATLVARHKGMCMKAFGIFKDRSEDVVLG